MNKRGLSTVVATVLIVLLTVIAVAMIASFVIPFIKNQLNKSTECMDVQNRFMFENSGLNCYNISANTTIISVKAQGDDPENKVKGFDMVMKSQGSGSVLHVWDGVSVSNLEMYSGESALKIPKSGEFFSYKYISSGVYMGAELKTALKSGKVCDMKSDEIKFGAC